MPLILNNFIKQYLRIYLKNMKFIYKLIKHKILTALKYSKTEEARAVQNPYVGSNIP